MNEAIKLLGEAYKELVDHLGPVGGIQDKILGYLKERTCTNCTCDPNCIPACCLARKILEDIEGPPMDWGYAEDVLKDLWWSKVKEYQNGVFFARKDFLDGIRTRELYNSIMELDND